MIGRTILTAAAALSVAACVPPRPPAAQLIPPARIVKVQDGATVPNVTPPDRLWIVFGSGNPDLYRARCDQYGGTFALDFYDGYVCQDVDY